MSYYSKAIKNIIFNWANLLVNIIISFFLAPFVVHKLGNTYYGIWVIMMQFTGYLYLMDFGVRESVVRYIAKYSSSNEQEKINKIIKAALVLYSAICFACLIATAILSFLVPYIFNIPEDTNFTTRIVVLITGTNVAQTFFFNVFIGIVIGLQRLDLTNKVGLVFTFIRVILVVYLLNKGQGVIALGLIQFFINLGTNITTYFISRNLLKFKVISIKPEQDVYKKIYNYSGLVLLNNTCEKIIFYTDTIVIGIFLSASSVTFYAIAGSLVQYVKRLVNSLAYVLNPLTSELEAKNETEKIKNILTQGSKFSLLVALPPCIIYLIMGRQFISLWMGPEYSALSGDVLIILTVTQIFSTPHYTINSILYGTSRHSIIAYCRTFEAMVNICLSLLLIKPFGIAGVAYGTAIPHIIVVLFFLPYFITKEVGIKYFEYFRLSYVGPFLSVIPFAIAAYWVKVYYPAESLTTFFGEVILLIPLFLISTWFIALNNIERDVITTRYLFKFNIFKK